MVQQALDPWFKIGGRRRTGLEEGEACGNGLCHVRVGVADVEMYVNGTASPRLRTECD